MIEALLAVIIACVIVQCLAPRACVFFDATLTRRRLTNVEAPPKVRRATPTVTAPVEHPRHGMPVDAATCDALARATRAGLTANQAVERVLGMQVTALANLNLLDPLLEAALVDGNFDPSGLDVAAAIIRDRDSCKEDTAVAVAQASMSVKILTVLPAGGLLMFTLLSSRFRTILVSPGMLAVVAVGLALNWTGRRWMKSLVARVNHPEPESITSLIDHLCVSLRCGYPLPMACERLGNTGECGQLIRSNLADGEPLDRALQPLVHQFGSEGQQFADLVVTAHRDGQPLLATIDRLAAESRATRRRDTDIRIRQLPGKMAAPLVACVLPSFMLLSVAPLVFISIGRLAHSLPLAQP